MLSAYGWIVVRTSRDCYKNVTRHDRLDDLDDQVDAEDRKLWKRLRNWLESHDDAWLEWQFFEEMNNDRGVLQFFTSRYHRRSCIWDLIGWIAKYGIGSYGLVYVHDDEDRIGAKHYGRGHADYTNVFRVWRILGGKVDELEDPFLSPIVPRVNPSEYA